MKPNLGPRTQAVVLLLLVATSSALAGVVADRLLHDRQAAAAAPPPGPWRWEPRQDMRYGERLYGALELTPAQRAAVDSIVAEQQLRIRELNEEFRPRFRAIAEQTRGRVEAVLTAEQRERLRELRETRARALRENQRMRGLRPGGVPGPGDDAGRERRMRERVPRTPGEPDSLVPGTPRSGEPRLSPQLRGPAPAATPRGRSVPRGTALS